MSGDDVGSPRDTFDEEEIAVDFGDAGRAAGVGYRVGHADRVDADDTGVVGIANRSNRNPRPIRRHTHTISALFVYGLSADIDEFIP